ncbi:MAG: PqqD family protein [Blastochloris sp.]|nr:PqqD family protein [Blastochloris sp.]
MHLSLDSYPAPVGGVVSQLINNEAVLVLPEQGTIKVLNEVGACIWQLADGSRTIREIAALVHAEYDAQAEQIEHDTQAFIAELVQGNVLRIRSGTRQE